MEQSNSSFERLTRVAGEQQSKLILRRHPCLPSTHCVGIALQDEFKRRRQAINLLVTGKLGKLHFFI